MHGSRSHYPRKVTKYVVVVHVIVNDTRIHVVEHGYIRDMLDGHPVSDEFSLRGDTSYRRSSAVGYGFFTPWFGTLWSFATLGSISGIREPSLPSGWSVPLFTNGTSH